jgi:hypothetical protein
VVAAIGLGVAGIASIGIVALVESSLRDPSSNLQFSAGSIRLAGPDLRIVSIAPVVIMPLVFLLLGAGIRIRGRVWRGLIWGAAVYLLVGLGMQTGWNIWWRDGLFAPYAGAFLFWPAHLALTIGSFF